MTFTAKRPKRLKLGDSARDRITGYVGIIIARTEWLNGCLRVTIQAEEMKDGKPVESQTFDAEQVELVVKVKPSPRKPKGGPSIPPVRKTDPI